MRKRLIGAVLAVAAIAVPFTAVAAANGDPRRSGNIPPGLAKKLTDPPPGFLIALEATVGSNSRLQDIPVSP